MFSPVFNAGTGTRLSQKFGVDLQVYPRVVTWVNVVGVSVFFTYWACMARYGHLLYFTLLTFSC